MINHQRRKQVSLLLTPLTVSKMDFKISTDVDKKMFSKVVEKNKQTNKSVEIKLMDLKI